MLNGDFERKGIFVQEYQQFFLAFQQKRAAPKITGFCVNSFHKWQNLPLLEFPWGKREAEPFRSASLVLTATGSCLNKSTAQETFTALTHAYSYDASILVDHSITDA